MQNKLIVLVAFLIAVPALAQTAIGRGAPGAGNGGAVEITLNGNVTSGVSLEISGTGTTVLSGTTTTDNPVAAVGTLSFGTFSTINPSTATNTTFAGRTTAGTSGAVVAASLSATMRFSGTFTGVVLLTRQVAAGAAPDVPAGNLRVASPALATWTAGTDGAPVPDPIPGSEFYVCTDVGGTCLRDVPYVHQLAVFVPDTQAAGPFSTVVTYVATAF